MYSFRDVDGREVPAMTSLRLGINGTRSEQVTPAPPSCDLCETSGGAGDRLRNHAASWRRRRSAVRYRPPGIETANAVAQTAVAGKLVVRPMVKLPVRYV